MIWLFIKGLNTDIQVLSIHITFVGKTFNYIADEVKKLKGVKLVGQAKALSKKSHNVNNFSGSYPKGHRQKTYSALPIQSKFLAFTKGHLGVVQQPLVSRG